MTYTAYVSTTNHMVANEGYEYVITHHTEWLQPEELSKEFLAYSIGLIEYCCSKTGLEFPEELVTYSDIKLDTVLYPESILMVEKYRKGYTQACLSRAIPEFLKHNVVVMEVGNAV